MVVERRGWVIAADVGQLVRREEPFVQRKAAAFARWHEPDDARVSSPESSSGSGCNSPARLEQNIGTLLLGPQFKQVCLPGEDLRHKHLAGWASSRKKVARAQTSARIRASAAKVRQPQAAAPSR